MAATATNKGPGALAALLAAHQNDPNNPMHLVNAAGAAALLGMPNEALALLDAADGLGGDFGSPMGLSGKAMALNNRGFALLQTGQWSAGQAVLTDALAQEPLLAEARTNLSTSFLCQGDISNAAKHIRAGIIRSPQQPDMEEGWDLSAGVAPNFPPLDYPAVAELLDKYQLYYGALVPDLYTTSTNIGSPIPGLQQQYPRSSKRIRHSSQISEL
jgi:tetratricopeptide (TPR) repeat protein